MLQGIHHKLGINSLCYAFYGMKCEACPKGDDVSYHSGCEMGSACLKPEVQRVLCREFLVCAAWKSDWRNSEVF